MAAPVAAHWSKAASPRTVRRWCTAPEKLEDTQIGGVVGGGAVEGGRDVGPVEPVEAHGQVGDRRGQDGDVAGSVEAVEGGVDQRQGLRRRRRARLRGRRRPGR